MTNSLPYFFCLLCMLLLGMLSPACVLSQSNAAGDYADWTTIGEAAYPRAEGQLATHDGKYYLFNGFTTNTAFLEKNEVYDPATNTYRTLSSIPRRADGSFGGYTHTAIAVVDDEIWLLGGRSGNDGYATTDEVWVYETTTDRWRQGPKLPERRGGGALARLGRKLHYVGGFDQFSSCDVDDHWVYDLERPELGWQDFSGTSPMPLARNHFGAATLGGKLYTVAGQHGHGGCERGKNLQYVHVYDPYTDRWERLADFPFPQSHVEPSTFAYNGMIYVLGGQAQQSASVLEYDPIRDRWRTLPDLELPLRLIAPGARVYENNLVVLGGGERNVGLARAQTRVRNFGENTGQRLAFNPSRVKTSGREQRTIELILANYSAEEEVSYSIDASDFPLWLTVDRTSGTARESFAEVEITVDPTELAPGTYRYTLCATAPGYEPARTDITFTVGEEVTSVPYQNYLEAECASVGSSWAIQPATSNMPSFVEVKPGRNSTSGPPRDDAENFVTFEFEMPRADHYQLFSRVSAPSSSDDSFYFRVNGEEWVKWDRDLTTKGSEFAWRRAPGATPYLPAGKSTIDIAYREDGLRIDKLLLSSTSYFPEGAGPVKRDCGDGEVMDANAVTAYWGEAECAGAASKWSRRGSAGASGQTYLTYTGSSRFSPPTTTEAADRLSFVTPPLQSGTYRLYLRLDAVDNGRNSCWVSVDNGPWIKYWKEADGSNLLTRGFEWRRVNDDTEPISFDLAAGSHTITIANRESGTGLDKVLLSTQLRIPTGLGASATDCDAQALAPPSEGAALNNVTEGSLEVYPNPAQRTAWFVARGGDLTGRVDLRLIDVNGRTVRSRQYDRGDELNGRVDVSDLAPGLYRLMLTDANGRRVATLVVGR